VRAQLCSSEQRLRGWTSMPWTAQCISARVLSVSDVERQLFHCVE
jgi:hypothetical protein